MQSFRYDTSGRWIKGNTHIHSTASDGGMTFAEIATLYASEGYEFLFRTDHWVASRIAGDYADYPLLWLDGIELHGADNSGGFYHVVGLGTFEGLGSEQDLTAGMAAVRRQNGLLILAHPFWTGNSLAEARRHGFDGVEVYNHVCHWMNGKSEGRVHWNSVLAQAPGTLAFAVDDAHLRPEHRGWNGGWIKINAGECTREAIMAAIRAGNFFSSCGPDFVAITAEGTRVTVRTSPVRFIRLVGPTWCGTQWRTDDGGPLTEASFAVPADWSYAYVELEDDHGRKAWTNPLFSQA